MWAWLDSTMELQAIVYGYPISTYAAIAQGDQITGRKELAAYIDWNQAAAVQELAEMREEFSWKPWATDEPFINRDRIIDETVDALHFLGNIVSALGCTDEEFWARYRMKQAINMRRATSGTYSAKKGGLAHGSDNE